MPSSERAASGDGGSSLVGWLISVVAVGARTPQIVKILRARSVEGIEPSLYEVRNELHAKQVLHLHFQTCADVTTSTATSHFGLKFFVLQDICLDLPDFTTSM